MTVIVEVVAIFMAIAGCVVKAQVGDAKTGAERKVEAVAIIEKEMTDKGGITLTNPYVIKALPLVLPFLIDIGVFLGNRTGFLGKSTG